MTAVHDALVLRSEWRNMVMGGDWATHWAWHPALGRWTTFPEEK